MSDANLMHDDGLVLFGVKSPMAVEYEETFRRLSIPLIAGVSLGQPVRLGDRSKLMSLDDCERDLGGRDYVPCAFTPGHRRQLHDVATDLGLSLCLPVVDPTAIVASTTQFDRGSYVGAGAVLGAMSAFGLCVMINRAATVGHHCLIGDFTSIGPGARLAGNIRTGTAVTIGVGAVVYPNVTIGEGAVVAGGAVVRKDVPADTVVAGNPAAALNLAPKETTIWDHSQE